MMKLAALHGFRPLRVMTRDRRDRPFRVMTRDRPLPEELPDDSPQLAGLSVVRDSTSAGRVRVARDVRDAWVTQRIDERWLAAFRLVKSGGRWRVGEARIFPAESDYAGDGEWSGCWRGFEAEAPRRGLTKQLLARAQPHMWLSLGDKAMRGFKTIFGSGKPERETMTASGRGRPAHDDVFLARVARDYASAVKAGRPPVKALAEKRGKTVARVRGWVHAARSRGFLTASVQGKTEGRLTPRATFVLETEAKRRKR